MATILLNNRSVSDLSISFLERLGLSSNESNVSSGDQTSFVENDKTSYFAMKELVSDLGSDDPTSDVKSLSDTSVLFETNMFNSENQSGYIKATFTGSKFKDKSQAAVTGFKFSWPLTNYKSDAKTSSEITSLENQSGALKLSFKASELATGTGSLTLTEQKNTVTGFDYQSVDGVKVKANFVVTGTGVGNTIVEPSGAISGLLTSFASSTKSDWENGTKYTDSMSFKSSVGLTYNEKDAWNGNVNSLNFSQAYTTKDYKNSLSFSDKSSNNLIATAISNFAAGTATVNDVSAALLSGKDKITMSGNEVLANGYEGNDEITCGKGNDTVAFSTALDISTNIDKITGFKKSGTDRIALDKTVFIGADASNSFVVGTVAASADQRIIYNKTTGALSYDADGAGSGVAIQFATIVGKVDVTASDVIFF